MCLLGFVVKSNYLVKLDEVYLRTQSKPIIEITCPKGMPVDNKIVSKFGYRVHPILKIVKLHKGIDLDAEIGDTVRSTINGKAILDRHTRGYGNTVFIKNKDYSIRVAHLSKVLVKPGDKIKKGQAIGLAGCTGLCSGPHVHYELYFKNKLINPLNINEVCNRHGSDPSRDTTLCSRCR